MCCVEVIKDNIVAIQTESAMNKKAMDKAIDTYLDIILDIQKNIRSLNKSITELYDLIHDNFSQLTKEDYSQMYKKLIRNLIGLYTTYRTSHFYSGIKTDLKNFKNGIDDLQEIGNDIRIFIVSLPQNNDYRNLVGLINSL
jgi:RNA processing factor Prp31